MFLGWFDIEAHPLDVASAMGISDAKASGLEHLDGDRAGLLLKSGPVKQQQWSGERIHAMLHGTPWPCDEPVDAACRIKLAALARACEAPGAQALARLGGGFAVAVLNAASGRLTLATDRFAQQPVYYSLLDSGIVFGSCPAWVASFAGRTPRMDPQSVFDYFYFHVIPGPKTVFEGVKRLEPASVARFRAGRLDLETYQHTRFIDADPSFDRQQASHEVRALMEAAVRRSASTANSVGAFLSGGIDSSSVAGNLAKLSDKPARAFSIGFEVDGYDETGFARTAARAFELEHTEYNVTPADIVELLPKLAGIYGQPFGNSSAVPTYFCARLAREHGIETLLGGDGGDELFGGNQRYAFQWLLGLYGHMPKRLARSIVEPALLGPSFIRSVPLLRKLRSYVAQASTPLPHRLEGFNLLGQLGVTSFFEPDFLGSVDPDHPHALQREVFASVDAASELNKILGFDFKLTLADNDLPKVRGMSEAAGITVQFPFLDPDVVDLSLRLPTREKVSGTRLRPFFKEASRGFLPDEILKKTKHGFGLPYGHWLRSHAPLQELSFDALASLKRRGIVQPAMIDLLTDTRLDEHASYYGSAIWLLVVFELWIKAFEEGRLLD